MKNNGRALTAGAIGILLLLASCSTSSFMGLSKASYVDSELEKAGQTAADLDRIEARIEELTALDSKIDRLDDRVNEALAEDDAIRERIGSMETETADLNAMALEFERRLDEMPDATLRELMAAIASHLEIQERDG